MKKYKGITWFCDECDAELDRQTGFSDYHSSWKCTNCGHINLIDDDNILDDDVANRVTYIESIFCCKECGGHHRKEYINGSYYWVCEDCGEKTKIDI